MACLHVLDRAGDVAAAGTALAGLILVYLGALAVRYESLNTKSKTNQRYRYQRHARWAVSGIVLALAAAVFALIAGSVDSHAELIADFAAILLVFSFGVAGIAAYWILNSISKSGFD